MSLLRTATHMAVASSVHGKVQRRQARRWAAADQAAAAQAPAPAPAAPPAPVTPAVPAAPTVPDGADAMSRQLDQLTQLGQLKAAGILTEAEFEAKKARILAG